MSKKRIALFISLGLVSIGSLTSILVLSNTQKENKQDVLLKATEQFKKIKKTEFNLQLDSINLSDIEYNVVNNNKTDNKLFSNSKENISQKQLKSFVLTKAKEFLEQVRSGEKDFNDFAKIAQQNGVDISNLPSNLFKNGQNNKQEEIKTFAFGSSIWQGTVANAAEAINDSAKQTAIYGGIAAGLAVGYWAASWWFGISIPSAIAATKQSVALFAESAAYGIAYLAIVNKSEYDSFKNTLLVAENVWQFRSLFQTIKTSYDSIKTITGVLRTIIYATSFAAPGALILLTVFKLSTSIGQAINFIKS